MAVYSEKYRYIFFANPNTASKAIAKTLIEKLEGKPMPDKEIKDGEQRLVRRHHSTYTQLVNAGLMTEPQLDALFKFTCVRNPFDQMVSKYVKHCARLDNDASKYPWLKAGKKEDKKAAKENKGPREGKKTAASAVAVPEQATLSLSDGFGHWLRHIEGRFAASNKMENGPLDFLGHADFVIRFEALQQGFDEVQQKLGISPPIQVEEFNVTAARAESPQKKRSYRDYYTPESVEIVTRMFAPVIEQFGYQFES